MQVPVLRYELIRDTVYPSPGQGIGCSQYQKKLKVNKILTKV